MGLLKVTILMSLIFEQDVVQCWGFFHLMLFSPPIMLLLMMLLVSVVTRKSKAMINILAEVEGRVNGEMSTEQVVWFSLPFVLLSE